VTKESCRTRTIQIGSYGGSQRISEYFNFLIVNYDTIVYNILVTIVLLKLKRLGLMGIVSEKRRGVKTCEECGCVNGVRAYECKQCDHPFKMKKRRKGRRKKLVENYKDLKKGDEIRVVGGSGDYYIGSDGDKHYFTERGTYKVHDTDDHGIKCYGKHGFTYLYMGKRCRSKLLSCCYKSPHKILLVS
jgi:hypothetical protein